MSRGPAPAGRYVPGSRRKPIQHGTIGGYRAHFRHGEPMCEPCKQANREYRGISRVAQPARCGTPSGYNRHHDRGEQACPACRSAQAQRMDEYLRARRGDLWPYEQLIPAVAELVEQGLTVPEIAVQLGVSEQRTYRARARAQREAS